MARIRNTEARWIESRERWQISVTGEDGERKTFVSPSPDARGSSKQSARRMNGWNPAIPTVCGFRMRGSGLSHIKRPHVALRGS